MENDGSAPERRSMVHEQLIRRGLRDPRVLSAMEKVPRHRFVPVDDQAWAYADGPLPIGHGQTISQPYIVALMTELLCPRVDSHFLEVGTGSGYQAAILSELVNEVHTIELIPDLAIRAERILHDLGCTNVIVHQGDGSKGLLEHAPYDGIVVTAGGPVVPAPLLDQLAEGGRLVIPVGGRGTQVLEVHHKLGGMIKCERNIPVAFVPLRGEYGWK